MKSYTNIEQSKVLAEILPFESADLHWQYVEEDNRQLQWFCFPKDFSINQHDTVSAWSLNALLGVLPRFIEFDTHYTFLLIYPTQNLGWVVEYSNHNDVVDFSFDNKNLIDACYEMIVKLHELKLL